MNFNPSEFSVCRNCGQKLSPYAMFCDNCGGNDILRPDQSSGQTAGNDMNAPDGQYAQGYQYAQNYSGQNQPVYYPDDRPQKKRGSALPIILASLLLLGVVGAGVWLFRDELGLTSETNDSSVGGTAVTTQADDADGGYSDSYGDNDGYSFSSAEQTEPSHELPNEAYDSSYLSFDTSGKIFDKCKASSYADWQGTRGLTCWAFDSKDTPAGRTAIPTPTPRENG